METCTGEQAVAELHRDADHGEAYAWPCQLATEATFAFAVVYRSGKRCDRSRSSSEHRTVALRRKKVSRRVGVGIMRGWIEIDAFKDDSPAECTDHPSVVDAIAYLERAYGVSEFFDHDAVGQRFRNRYLRD